MQPESSDANQDEAVRKVLEAARLAGIPMTPEDAAVMVGAVERNRGYGRVARSFISKTDEPAHVFRPSSPPEDSHA